MSGTVLTNKGLALITKLVAASTELQISRVAVGTGRVPSGVDPQTMVDLNEYKMDAQIESYGVSPDQSDVAYIAAQVSSIGVSAGFAVTEAGVFATDPDVGEILYAYLDLTEDPQYIYAETDAISKFAEITFNVLIGSVAKVTAYVSPGALTKKVDFNAFKESVETPEFDDSGTVEGISSFPSFLETMKSKMNFFQFFRNLKAGLQFVLHAGQIVNNCVTDNAGLPLSAAQGKVLKDLYTQLYSEVGNINIKTNFNKRDSNMVQLEGFTEGNVEGMVIQATKDGKFYASGKFDGTWNSSVGLVTKNDVPTRYGGTGIIIPVNKSCKIYTAMAGKIFNALVFVQGTTSVGFGTFIISGYGGDGGAGRYHVLNLNTSDTSSKITCTVGDGTYFIVKNDTNSSVQLLIEEFFNQGEITCSII